MNILRFFPILVALFAGQAFSSPLGGDGATPLHSAFFAFDSSILSERDRRAIARLTQTLSPPRNLQLVGYTDDTGPLAYNAYLARQRAQAVRDALVASGYPGEQLQIATRPGMAAVGRRAQLRRVDIVDANGSAISQANNMPIDSGAPDNGEANPLRVGRYSVVAPVPSEAQRDPLQTLVRITFPRAIRTVGDALDHLLARSGWRQADASSADPSLTTLLALPLPETQRRLGPVPLIDAVRVLCGSAYGVVIDPVHRLLSCEIKSQYAAIGGKTP